MATQDIVLVGYASGGVNFIPTLGYYTSTVAPLGRMKMVRPDINKPSMTLPDGASTGFSRSRMVRPAIVKSTTTSQDTVT